MQAASVYKHLGITQAISHNTHTSHTLAKNKDKILFYKIGKFMSFIYSAAEKPAI